jgi:hypothetical protein
MQLVALAALAVARLPPVPNGVNLGGWLVLEDWFYGKNGSAYDSAFHVTTPRIQGPVGFSQNIDPSSRPFMFTSETDLLTKLDKPVASLQVHRDHYVDVASELAAIASHGIKYVRLPITWCFNWRDEPLTIYGATSVTLPPRTGEVLVRDPFLGNTCGVAGNQTCQWLAIPEWRVIDVLARADALGLKVLLDIHAFPGGSSDGTYNGVWPLAPAFWTSQADANFAAIVGGLIEWMEELANRNASAFSGLYGLTPMNEPGLGMPGGTAAHLDTLAIALQLFRASRLPAAGKYLLMNMIQISSDAAASWWLSRTTATERAQWAVIDLHHYIAWPGVDWCANSSRTIDELRRAVDAAPDTWQWSARTSLRLTNSSALVAMSEFSGSTHEDTTKSCSPNNVAFGDPAKAMEVVRYFVSKQVQTSAATNVIDFFWKWHLPFNSNFRTEWSLKHILATDEAAEQAPPH